MNLYHLVDKPRRQVKGPAVPSDARGGIGGGLTLRTKIVAIMAIPFVVLVAATVALVASRDSATAALEAERQAVTLQSTFERILVDLTDAETGTRGYILTGDGSFLGPFHDGSTRLAEDLADLRALTATTSVTLTEVVSLQVMTNTRLSIMRRSQLLAPVNDLTNHDRLNRLLTEGRLAMERIRELVDSEESQAQRLLAARQESLDAKRRVTFLIGIVGMPLGLLASLLVVLLFTQHLVTRIRRTEDLARMLEEGMPPGQATTSDDELGRLDQVLVRSGTRVVELQDELRRMGTTDPLTRLMNRRGFLPTAEHHLEMAKRTHMPTALMFLDLDGLKHVNDKQGHAAGDAMITEAAYVLRQTFRASDLIARMGGDEFCVLFATESQATADEAMTRLQESIRVANAEEGRPFVLSFSTGVAVFDPEQPWSLDQLMASADERMYVNKRAKTSTQADVAPVA
jgi:diguanylate cyclase (GGDEF)-like protein